MFGGAFLLRRFLDLGGGPTPFQLEWLRAGHAHGGVLVLMSLLYYTFLDQTPLPGSVKRAASAALLVGVLAQFGGFFLHAVVGRPNEASLGTAVTASGAVPMAGAVLVLVYGLIRARSPSATSGASAQDGHGSRGKSAAVGPQTIR
jgi:drug/metabolite transporter superfamily protein YnfA